MTPERTYSLLLVALTVLFLILCHCAGISITEP